MNTSQAADKLETDARTLRRFLRQDATYRNAGSGGRYEFTDRDVPKLKERFNKWREGAAAKTVSRETSSTPKVRKSRVKDNTGDVVSVRALNSRDPKVRAMIRARAEERVDRLEASLRERGLHISQMREREVSA